MVNKFKRLNLNSSLREFDNSCKQISVEVDRQAIEEHTSNFSNSETLGGKVNLYPKTGDIAVYAPNSNKVITVINGIKYDDFKETSDILKYFQYAGIVESDYQSDSIDGKISLIVNGPLKLSIERGARLKNGDGVKLHLPNKSTLKKMDREERITFSLTKWEPEPLKFTKLNKSDSLLKDNLKKIYNGKFMKVEPSNLIKCGDISKAMMLLQLLASRNLIKITEDLGTDKIESYKYKARNDNSLAKQNKTLNSIASFLSDDTYLAKQYWGLLYDTKQTVGDKTISNVMDNFNFKKKKRTLYSYMIKNGVKLSTIGLNKRLMKDRDSKIATVLDNSSNGLTLKL